MKRLNNKTALVTGAAKGIGAQVARLMAQQGAFVFVGDVLVEEANQVVNDIIDSGGQAVSISLDVTSESDWQDAINKVLERTGQLDILVNNAGYFLGKGIEDATLSEWRKLVDVNMTSVFLGTKICAPALRLAGRQSEHGSAIVNLSSIAGLVAAPNCPLYGMTKGGVTIFTKSAAVSFAENGDRIRVNSVHPGVVNTAMGHQAIAAQANRIGLDNTKQIKKLENKIHPMGRLAETTDIANAIVFLASDEAGFITGTSIPVDGGYTAR